MADWSGETGEEGHTLLIKRTLRSGQRINFDGNVVIVGDVNPGAEVVAAGHVIVMGQLRGVVHAGAAGDENAVVMALKLLPTQLRIAGHITRPPDEEKQGGSGPEIASIKNGIVTIESYY
ncbi:MAG: septum site-determining protein MinC [Desulfurispora sp.]|uniref:septum site-determining protein MinC n=1 Tax=Desulfurispora sp. TaxID=3014275 RepID=UPI004049403D